MLERMFHGFIIAWYNIDMRKSIERVVLSLTVFVALVIGVIFWASQKPKDVKNYNVVTSNFVAYDFARAVADENVEIKMLLKPGAEAHDFEPTPEDVIEIEKADLFIYNGGESEEWVERLLSSNEIPAEKTFKMMDQVSLLEEEEGEYDEHIWTSPKNAIILAEKISEKLPKNTEKTASYIKRLEKIDQDFREVVKNSSKKKLIFGDRFPFLYFVHEYGLEFAAAFPGCSEQTEASSKTIAELVTAAKEAKAKAILKIELTSDKIARTIAEEAGGLKVLEFSAAHNISEQDFKAGVTYADLMEKNLKILSEILE